MEEMLHDMLSDTNIHDMPCATYMNLHAMLIILGSIKYTVSYVLHDVLRYKFDAFEIYMQYAVRYIDDIL